MNVPLQRVLLLVLAALVPVVAYVSARADVVAAVAAVNVLLIWVSIRVATGGSPQPAVDTADTAPADDG